MKDQMSALDPERMVTDARRQKVLPFLGVFLKDQGMIKCLPSDIRDRMLGNLQQAEWQNIIKRMEFEKINRLFEKEDIPVIPLKGIALTHLVYKENPVRMMGDIDILIKEENLAKAGHLLEAEGFELQEFTNRWQDKINRRLIGRWSYVKEGWDVDVQWKPRFLIGGKLVEWNCKHAWQNASPCPALGSNVLMLSGLDFVQYLLFQIANDFEINIPFLIQFLDLALVMTKNQLTKDQVLSGNLALLPPGVKARLEELLEVVDECFFEDREFQDFSKKTKKILEFFFLGRSDTSRTLGALSFLKMARSSREKIIFFAGYFFPSKRYLQKTYGSGFFSLIAAYFKHLKRLLFKVLSSISS